jgi:serine/threonine-protein kinase
MASVWCAEDRVLGRSVAIKVLGERFAQDESAVRRFKREARAAARVSAHPYVVTIFDVGDIEPADGDDAPPRAFIVMEHLTGGSVADAIRVGAVQRPEALRWLREAASALDHAHERGIVHRDIKPSNLLLDNARRLHVADFGIARLVSEETITASGELFGTAAYLAPEQALGREATSASDRYALAVAAFELLAGQRPFAAPHFAAQARQHIEDERPRASERRPDLPAAVDPVLARGMAIGPAERYETAAAFVDALEPTLDGPSTATTRVIGKHRRIVGPAAAGAAAAPFVATEETRALEPPRRARAATANATRRRPVRPPGPRTVPSPITPSSLSKRHGGRLFALAALTVAIVGVALMGILSQGGAGPSRPPATSRLAARSTAARSSAKSKTRTTKAPARPTASASGTTAAAGSGGASSSTSPSVPSTAGASAAELDTQGHQLMLAGSYPAAITDLREAVSAADPSSLTYAYALYDLGRSLVLSGDPQAAIPVLRERLEIPNQTPVVQQMLNQALQATGQSGPAQPSGGAAPVTDVPAKPEHGPAGYGSPGHSHSHGPQGHGGD